MHCYCFISSRTNKQEYYSLFHDRNCYNNNYLWLFLINRKLGFFCLYKPLNLLMSILSEAWMMGGACRSRRSTLCSPKFSAPSRVAKRLILWFKFQFFLHLFFQIWRQLYRMNQNIWVYLFIHLFIYWTWSRPCKIAQTLQESLV